MAGARDGRVGETLRPELHSGRSPGFDAESEWHSLHDLREAGRAKRGKRRSYRRTAPAGSGKEHAAKDLQGAALENQIRKNRFRWLREYLTESGMKRAKELGWPNTYTLTKSLAESLIAKYGAGLADCRCAAGDRRDFGGEAIYRME